jgi:hypothetical protein
MYSINVKKFQNTPRNAKGIAAVAAKRTRLPDAFFERMDGDHAHALHPTKGVEAPECGSGYETRRVLDAP